MSDFHTGLAIHQKQSTNSSKILNENDCLKKLKALKPLIKIVLLSLLILKIF